MSRSRSLPSHRLRRRQRSHQNNVCPRTMVQCIPVLATASTSVPQVPFYMCAEHMQHSKAGGRWAGPRKPRSPMNNQWYADTRILHRGNERKRPVLGIVTWATAEEMRPNLPRDGCMPTDSPGKTRRVCTSEEVRQLATAPKTPWVRTIAPISVVLHRLPQPVLYDVKSIRSLL